MKSLEERIEVLADRLGIRSDVLTAKLEKATETLLAMTKQRICEECGTIIKPGDGGVSIMRKGKRVYFCSIKCFDCWRFSRELFQLVYGRIEREECKK